MSRLRPHLRLGPRVALAVAALLAVAGCSGGADEPSSEPPTVAPTPLADFHTAGLTVARADFCARVAPAAVEDALGAEADQGDTWANGDRARLGNGVRDVAHEFGCRWKAADGTTATAWVFAPPVTRRRASELRDDAARTDGCRKVADAPRFGSHSVAVRCDDGTTAFHGLFGDAWLSCAVRTKEPSGEGDLEQVGRWCVSVAQAATA